MAGSGFYNAAGDIANTVYDMNSNWFTGNPATGLVCSGGYDLSHRLVPVTYRCCSQRNNSGPGLGFVKSDGQDIGAIYAHWMSCPERVGGSGRYAFYEQPAATSFYFYISNHGGYSHFNVSICGGGGGGGGGDYGAAGGAGGGGGGGAVMNAICIYIPDGTIMYVTPGGASSAQSDGGSRINETTGWWPSASYNFYVGGGDGGFRGATAGGAGGVGGFTYAPGSAYSTSYTASRRGGSGGLRGNYGGSSDPALSHTTFRDVVFSDGAGAAGSSSGAAAAGGGGGSKGTGGAGNFSLGLAGWSGSGGGGGYGDMWNNWAGGAGGSGNIYIEW